MSRYCYDPAVDRQEVDQFGFVDLRKSFESGIISGDATMTDESFNGVGAPALLLPHAQDVFESLRQANYVTSALERARSKEVEELAQKVSEKTSVVSGVSSE